MLADDIPPEIQLSGPASLTVNQCQDISDQTGATATDLSPGGQLVLIPVIQSGSFQGTDEPGTFFIQYDATGIIVSGRRTFS